VTEIPIHVRFVKKLLGSHKKQMISENHCYLVVKITYHRTIKRKACVQCLSKIVPFWASGEQKYQNVKPN